MLKEITIEKGRIRKDYSHVIKSSMLTPLIEKINSDEEFSVQVVYLQPKISKNESWILDAQFWTPNEHVNHYRFYIRPGCVKSEQRKLTFENMEKSILPKLIDWMDQCLDSIKLIPARKHFCIEQTGDKYYLNGEKLDL